MAAERRRNGTSPSYVNVTLLQRRMWELTADALNALYRGGRVTVSRTLNGKAVDVAGDSGKPGEK